MPRFIIYSTPFWGLINPLLPIVHELVARGSEVTFYATLEFKEAIQATGAHFRPYLRGSHSEVSSSPSRHFTTNRQINVWHFILEQLQEDARDLHADCILYESADWCRFLPKMLNLPAIRIGVTLPMNATYHPCDPIVISTKFDKSQFSRMKSDLDKLCTAFHIPLFDFHDFYFKPEPLNIVCMPREFHPAADSFDERFLFVGPCINPAIRPESSRAFSFDERDELPLFYVALGTLHNVPAFYDICITALAEVPQRVVISVGEYIDTDMFGPLPSNVSLYSGVPQLAILPKTEVFITHGGINSIMEALYYNVPMVVAPQSQEQLLNAECVEKQRLGLVIRKPGEVTAHRLRNMVEQVRNDEAIRANVKRMSEIATKSGGYLQAADAILQFCSHL